MTLQDIYASVYAIAALKVGDTELSKIPAVAELAAALEKATREEAAKKSGTCNALKTVERMLAKVDEARTALRYQWKDDQGRQCVCDGFRAYRLTAPLDLPARPENAGKGIDLAKVFPASADNMTELSIPAAADLRAAIAVQKAENKAARSRADALYRFGEGLPAVNAAYLLDMITVMDSPRLYFKDCISPLYCVGSNGDAVLLPVRIVTAAAKVEAKKPEAKSEPTAPAENAAAKVEAAKPEPAALIAAREAIASGKPFAEVTLEELETIADYIAA